MDLFSKSSDIHNGVSGHVECVIMMQYCGKEKKK